MASSVDTFSVGDIIRFHRGEYSHLAIYAGRNTVIHLWSPTNDRSFQVRIDSIRYVQQCQPVPTNTTEEREVPSIPVECNEEMDERMHREYGVSAFDGDTIVERARTRLGETRYNCMSYNCEHFVTWARYGVGSSPQATSHTNQVLAGALMGAVVGGAAGFVIGGLISHFSKAQALSVSSSGAASMGIMSISSDGTAEVVHEEEVVEVEQVEMGRSEAERLQHRRQERERLLETVSSIQLDDNDTNMEAFDTWAASRNRTRTRLSVPTYGNERHLSLATRLAEDKLLCGICFYDLQLTKAVAFPCDHFTCAKCFEALVTNPTGQKCCPYCRMHILEVQLIHRTTKTAARERMTWDEGTDTNTTHSRNSPLRQQHN